ncbi:MAG: aldo/keto reductase, partial [Bacteroidaceae bacterium]|nr:aldo/keto reductase [Bacteroidaceae bacterium]
MENENKGIDRREFLKRLGLGTAAVASTTIAGCGGLGKNTDGGAAAGAPIPTDKMTFRKNNKTGESVSILGYGCMRWPTMKADAKDDGSEGGDVIDQEQVNRLVDYAIEHGVN